jgi:hypothetical protein
MFERLYPRAAKPIPLVGFDETFAAPVLVFVVRN